MEYFKIIIAVYMTVRSIFLLYIENHQILFLPYLSRKLFSTREIKDIRRNKNAKQTGDNGS